MRVTVQLRSGAQTKNPAQIAEFFYLSATVACFKDRTTKIFYWFNLLLPFNRSLLRNNQLSFREIISG